MSLEINSILAKAGEPTGTGIARYGSNQLIYPLHVLQKIVDDFDNRNIHLAMVGELNDYIIPQLSFNYITQDFKKISHSIKKMFLSEKNELIANIHVLLDRWTGIRLSEMLNNINYNVNFTLSGKGTLYTQNNMTSNIVSDYEIKTVNATYFLNNSKPKKKLTWRKIDEDWNTSKCI
jgi:hypothetical protein